jgi:transcriptional regulator with XRE-family HTH domain
MRREGDPQDWRLVILLVRALKGWTYQQDMAQACRIDVGSISDYERGHKVPSPATRERMAAGLGVKVSFLDQLVPLCRGIRLAFERARRTGSAEAMDQQQVEEKITVAVLEALAPFLLELTQLGGEPAPRAEDHAWAEEQWKAMVPLAAEDQRLVATTLRSERSWALAARICEASAAAVLAQSPAEALRLAELAVDLVREVPEGPWRLRLLGWCEPFLADAHRAAGNLKATQEVFARADEHWEQGAGGDPAGLLDSSRRLALKSAFLMRRY